MKKILYKSLVCAGALSLLMLSSCNYEEINTNPYEMTDEMGAMDGITMGASVTTMQWVRRLTVPISSTSIKNPICFRQTDGADILPRIMDGLQAITTCHIILLMTGYLAHIRILILNCFLRGRR